jgi:hypothetical protein
MSALIDHPARRTGASHEPSAQQVNPMTKAWCDAVMRVAYAFGLRLPWRAGEAAVREIRGPR